MNRYAVNADDYTRMQINDALVRIKATRQMVAIIQQIAEISGWEYALATCRAWEGR
jgi:hypothetical protein